MKRMSDLNGLYPAAKHRKVIYDKFSFVDILTKAMIKVTTGKIGDSVLAPMIEWSPRISMDLAWILRVRFVMGHLLAAHPEVMQPYFQQVKRFCLFLSTARSGHSIMAHLLTAHPKVQISDELSAVSYFESGYSIEQVSALIKYQDYHYMKRKRKKSGYDYQVDGVWQNEYEKYPEVIGDAKGSRTTNLMGLNGQFLNHLRSTLKMPLRVIVHLRNPFDTISTRSRKRGIKLHRAVSHFIKKERIMAAAFDRLAKEERLVQRHEDVIKTPEKHFIQMFEFLGVDPMPEVVAACAGKIWERPNLTRKKIDWPKEEVDRLEQCLKKSQLFQSYLSD
jgi:hypothetical protein